ncbi:MAG: SURF1 family protein [Jatrophihabitans sp.]
MFRTLRQPRYAALGVLMIVIAIVCVACGTWQIYRFEAKKHANDHLRANAERVATGVATVLPTLGSGPRPSRDAVEFRAVRATGVYDDAGQSLVRSRTLGDDTGFLVLTPLRTTGPILLVVRGFITQPTSGAIPIAPAPPAGQVTVLARAQLPETGNDRARENSGRQVQTINPGQQASRLGGRLYDGYAELEPGQPGTDGLRAIPRPDLSNPAGGALEPQHFAYVIQWYLFALLALAAPLAMARAETKHHESGDFDDAAEPEPVSDAFAEFDDAPTGTLQDARAAKLADRYGRPVH